MLQVCTVWCRRDEEGKAQFRSFPPRQAQGRADLVLTNDASAFFGLGSAVFPIAELYRLAFPLSATGFESETADSAEKLFALWEKIRGALLGFPCWTLLAFADVYQDLDETAVSQLFRSLAAEVSSDPDARRSDWMNTFAATVDRNPSPRNPALSDCTPLNDSRIASFFKPGGELSRMMPGYEPRPGQIAMACDVARAFSDGGHLIAEAGTGVGKSLAYLVPAACWALLNDVPVVVSTNTKNLQTQLIEHDLPTVRKILSMEAGKAEQLLKVALLKGRKNYLCLRNFASVLENNNFSYERPKRRLFAEIAAWAAFTGDGDLDTLQVLHPQVAENFASEFSSSSEECSGRKCRFFKRCFVQKARLAAAKAHIVVANHSLVFADASAPGKILPIYSQVVFDEAHNLEEAATDHYSLSASEAEIGKILRRLLSSKTTPGLVEKMRKMLDGGGVPFGAEEAKQFEEHLQKCTSLLEIVRKNATAFFAQMQHLIPGGSGDARYRCIAATAGTPPTREFFRNRVFIPCESEGWDEEKAESAKGKLRIALSALVDNLREAAKKIDDARAPGELPLFSDSTSLLEGAAAELDELSLNIEFLFSAQDTEYVFWASRQRRSRGGKNPPVVLKAAPLSVGEALARDLYKTKNSIVFSSATLRYNSSFSFIGRRLGLGLAETGRLDTCLAESPFDYSRQCRVLAADFLPPPEGEAQQSRSYKEQLGALLCDIFRITGGRALALFTSFEAMSDVAAQVEFPLREAGVRLLVHNRDGSRDEITAQFKKSKAAVLFGVQSFWEGVDIPGEALQYVVICRLPFPSVGDPVFSARCEQIKASGRSDFREYSIPQAVIRFRQGFGRLIRTCSDSGMVIIADSRFASKGYGRDFRNSLPCAVETVSSREMLIDAVAQWQTRQL